MTSKLIYLRLAGMLGVLVCESLYLRTHLLAPVSIFVIALSAEVFILMSLTIWSDILWPRRLLLPSLLSTFLGFSSAEIGRSNYVLTVISAVGFVAFALKLVAELRHRSHQ